MYHCFSKKRDDIHSRTSFIIDNLDENNLKEILEDENIQYFDAFDNMVNAREERDKFVLQQCKEYTEFIIKEGFPPSERIQLYTSRCICVFVTDEITKTPGVYEMTLYDYVLLKKLFNSIRLPTIDELNDYQVKRTLIKLKPDLDNIFDLLPTNEIHFIKSDATEEDLDNLHNTIDDLFAKLPVLFYHIQQNDLDSANEVLKEMHPELDDSEYENHLLKYIDFANQLQNMEENNASEDEILDFVTEFYSIL